MSNLTLKNDVIFKSFFGRKENEYALKDFLEGILEVKINSLKVKTDVELPKVELLDKYGVLDILAILDDGTLVNIEMQNANEHNIEKRICYYSSRMVVDSISESENYNKIPKIEQITILDYNLTNLEEFCTRTIRVAKNNRNVELINIVGMTIIELPKFLKNKDKDFKNKISS